MELVEYRLPSFRRQIKHDPRDSSKRIFLSNRQFHRISHMFIKAARLRSIYNGKWRPFFDLQNLFCILLITQLSFNYNPWIWLNQLFSSTLPSGVIMNIQTISFWDHCVVVIVHVHVIKIQYVDCSRCQSQQLS